MYNEEILNKFNHFKDSDELYLQNVKISTKLSSIHIFMLYATFNLDIKVSIKIYNMTFL